VGGGGINTRSIYRSRHAGVEGPCSGEDAKLTEAEQLASIDDDANRTTLTGDEAVEFMNELRQARAEGRLEYTTRTIIEFDATVTGVEFEFRVGPFT